jgi:hypothetical protein
LPGLELRTLQTRILVTIPAELSRILSIMQNIRL